MSAEFVDTNIHVYARDRAAGIKHATARSLVERLWNEGAGATSVQILSEFYAVATRKIAHPLMPADARMVVRNLSFWKIHSPAPEDVLAAIDRSTRLKLSYGDALMLQSAVALGCSIVWTEDLQHNAVHDGVRVRNPFVRGV